MAARTDTGDRAWSALLGALGGLVLVVAGLIVLVLGRSAYPAIQTLGLGTFLSGQEWDPVAETFGALPFIYGTLVTSAIALAVALPVSLGLAIFLSEMAPKGLRPVVSFCIETLASIPSVVYGLWALFVMVPWLRGAVEPFLIHTLGFLPLFKGPALGLGYLAAGLVLAVMILPTLSSVCTEVLRTAPVSLNPLSQPTSRVRFR
ncbi:MAG: PstC family ABC transporter permease, partial [Archangium sp.]